MEILELNHEDVLQILPDRDPWGHKGSFGKILLLCGSRGFTGAAYLSAMGALRSGAGLTFLGVPESIYAIEAMKLNEPVVFPLPDSGGMVGIQAVNEILERLPKMDAVLIGCGCGQSEELYALLTACLTAPGCPLVLDADALNTLAAHGEEGGALLAASPRPVVLTPHPLEFARLSGMSVAQVQEDRTAAAAELAARLHTTVVLKGAGTVVACPDGSVSRNTSGCAALAKGGSGDVLAGCITAFLAQGCRPEEAARIAVYLHGRAGETLAQTRSLYGVLPSELACAIAGEIAKL